MNDYLIPFAWGFNSHALYSILRVSRLLKWVHDLPLSLLTASYFNWINYNSLLFLGRIFLISYSLLPQLETLYVTLSLWLMSLLMDRPAHVFLTKVSSSSWWSLMLFLCARIRVQNRGCGRHTPSCSHRSLANEHKVCRSVKIPMTQPPLLLKWNISPHFKLHHSNWIP